MTDEPDSATLRRLLKSARRIAVVGLSPKPHRDSNRVARYLLDHGYDVVPVYPRENEILGRPVVRRIQDILGGVDVVDVFRRSEELDSVVDDALSTRVPLLWFQLGCINAGAAQRARDGGRLVVMDRCLMVEHAHLFGQGLEE
jgi:predicted CoA-binding protein